MRPQFVDFDGDGRIDILAATYDGSPHVAFASAEGFREPKHVLDARGDRILLSQFWNYDAETWDDTGDEPDGHCTSAVAFDWDADGDLDLLLGDYQTGKLFRRMNEGTAAEPRFAAVNVPVEADGEPFEQPDGLSTPVIVDWDGDGLEDLVCGGYADGDGDGPGAGVWWYRNAGQRGAPRFAQGKLLIPRSTKGAAAPVRPDSGLYPDPVDFDGDGRLDLLVGGYSHWTPPGRVLTAEESERADELEAEVAAREEAIQQVYEGLNELENLAEEERDEAVSERLSSKEFQELQQGLSAAQAALQELRPGPMREAFVWLYRRER